MRGVQTMKVTHLPKDDASCGWLALLGELPPPRPLLGAHRAEWVVVGAGCTGLAAARRLAELLPETRILLLDGQRVGEGASGRNSGFIIDLPHNVDAQDIEDRAANERVQRLNLAAIAELKGLVDRHAIACDWQRGSKIHAAAEPVGERELDDFSGTVPDGGDL